MKKSALTILVLLILSTIGCGDAYKANNTSNVNNNSTNIQQVVSINPSKPLAQIMQNIENSITIKKLTVVEAQNRTMELHLVPPSNDADEITEQFIRAYQKNTDFIKKLLPDDPDNPNIQDATDQERSELEALSQAPKTPETILVSSVTVSGPNDEIKKFKKSLEE